MKRSATESELTPAQVRVLASLSAGMSITDAAQEAGVTRTTVWRWSKLDAKFIAELNALRLESADRLRSAVAAMTDDALAALRGLLAEGTRPDVRMRAIELVLARAVPPTPAEPMGSPLAEDVALKLARDESDRKSAEWVSAILS